MPAGADGIGDGTATGSPRSAEGNASPAGPVCGTVIRADPDSRPVVYRRSRRGPVAALG